MLEQIVWHGRAGQGVITVSQLLAHAAIIERKYAQAFPEFGPERLGSPITAFTRISDQPIEVRCQIRDPSLRVVLDPTLLKQASTARLMKGVRVIINSPDFRHRALEDIAGAEVYVVNATKLALDMVGAPIVNTIMLGALVKVTGVVSLNSLEAAMVHRFDPSNADMNIALAKLGAKEVRCHGG